ncbi:MAG: TfoX/Sxy family protein [Bacteroidia bacterium]|nr:TfoX/Sxy family protein [Bacteroidia bacterium]
MPYNENLAKIVHDTLVALNTDFVEKKMFGGIAFMIQEKMACGIVKDELMVRVLPERFEEALQKPFARQMDFTGKPMKGFLFVAEEGFESEAALSEWLRLGIEFAQKGEVKSRKK